MARQKFSNEFKARVALEAIKGDQTIAQLASQYGVHASQINTWKRQAQEHMTEAFSSGRGQPTAKQREAREDQLYQQIGKLQVEVDWLRKKSRALGLM